MAFISIENLTTHYDTSKGKVHALEDVSFSLEKGQSVGIAGESACGKSTLGLSLIRMIPNGKIISGKIIFDGKSFLEISDSEFDLFSALILAPAFISAIVSPAMIRRLNEEDCGKWWSAICGPQFRPATSVLASSIILPIPLTYLSWFVLEGLITGEVDQNAIYWLWLPSLVIIDISCASTALHMLVSDLRRSSAAAASLLLVVLVWPFIQVVDALSMILDNGMTWEFSTSSPLMSLIFASVISAMVWAVAIFIPDA